jgi:uncharacterized phage protein (TIGR01671 family)
MREIKFRALKDDMSNCTFQYGQLVYDANGVPRITNNGLLFTTCIKGTEGQFTGLKDKNGKEIYEGDVLRYVSKNPFSLGEARKVRVYYIEARFWCNGSGIGIYLGELLVEERCEVIGNIHENP